MGVIPRGDGYLIVVKTSKKQVMVLRRDGEVRRNGCPDKPRAAGLAHTTGGCVWRPQVQFSLRIPSDSDVDSDCCVAVSRCGNMLGLGNEKGEVHVHSSDLGEVRVPASRGGVAAVVIPHWGSVGLSEGASEKGN